MAKRYDLAGEAVNVGSGSTLEILDIAKRIIELTGSKSKIIFQSPRPGEVPVLHADISKAREVLEWEPKHSFDDGLLETVKWCQNNRRYLKPARVSKSL